MVSRCQPTTLLDLVVHCLPWTLAISEARFPCVALRERGSLLSAYGTTRLDLALLTLDFAMMGLPPSLHGFA